jgi:hypothetical protein
VMPVLNAWHYAIVVFDERHIHMTTLLPVHDDLG